MIIHVQREITQILFSKRIKIVITKQCLYDSLLFFFKEKKVKMSVVQEKSMQYWEVFKTTPSSIKCKFHIFTTLAKC